MEYPTIYISPQANQLYEKMLNGEEPSLEEINSLSFSEKLRLGCFPEVAPVFEQITGTRGVPLANDYKVEDYQVNVLNWMAARADLNPYECHGISGGILHLDMGLGKSFITLLYAFTRLKGPFLVISSKTILPNWVDECRKFFGEAQMARVKVLHKDYCDVKSFSTAEALSYDIVFTTYDVVKRKENEHLIALSKHEYYTKVFFSHRATAAVNYEVYGSRALFCMDWEGIFADESQTFANEKTGVYGAVMGLVAKSYWCLTGTPIRNRSSDMLSQLRFIGYGNVSTTQDFDSARYIKSNEWLRKGELLFKTHCLNNCVFSLDYVDAQVSIPPKHAYLETLEFSDMEKRFYDRATSIASSVIARFQQKIVTYAHVLAIFVLLRQVCISPYLINPEAKLKLKKEEKANEFDLREHLNKLQAEDPELMAWIRDKKASGFGCTKVQEIIELVKQILAEKQKVVIFNTFTSALVLIEEALKDALPGVNTSLIDGSIETKMRKLIVDEFKRSKTLNILLINTKVGSEGLNIATAKYTINPGAWWSPFTDDQAEARIFRRGQTQETHCFTLAMKGSIEEKVLEVCSKKRVIERGYASREGFTSRGAKQDINFYASLLH